MRSDISRQSYSLLDTFANYIWGIEGLQNWNTNPDQLPEVGINATGQDQYRDTEFWPAGAVGVHPGWTEDTVVGWKSPISGVISIDGGVSHLNPACGEGINWFIDKNELNIASGTIDIGGQQYFQDGTGGDQLAELVIGSGDFLYFAVDPKGNYSCDFTKLDIQIRSISGVYLDPPQQSKDGGRAEGVIYQETLTNNSGITDNFDLDASGNLWDTQLSTDQIGPLQDGESESFIITVTVPADAPWYSTDNATIHATGVTSPSLTAEAQITTTAFAPPLIGVEPDSLESTQVVGAVTTQTMTISNGPGVTLTYDIFEGTYPGNVLSLHLDEPEGSTTFYDTSGYANNATCSGDACPVAGVPGAVGTALNFDGVDDFIQIPHNAAFDQIEDQDKVSITAWVNSSYWPFMIMDQYLADWDSGWEFFISLIWTENYAMLFKPHDNYEIICEYNFNMAQWYHVAVTYDRSIGTIQFYVDGNQICNYNNTEDIMDTYTSPMYIGYSPSGGDEHTTGLIDEFYVFDRALSSDEITALYQGSLSGEVPWLSVDPVSGSVPTNDLSSVQVTFDATGLQPDIYTTTLYVVSNDPLTPIVEIPVSLTVNSVPPESATITGPEAGRVGESQEFTALVEPISTTLPLTYIWQVDGQVPITQTGGLTDTNSFIWDMPGTQIITITASNPAGEVYASHTITITTPIYDTYLPLVIKPVGAPLGTIPVTSSPERGVLLGLVTVGIVSACKRKE